MCNLDQLLDHVLTLLPSWPSAEPLTNFVKSVPTEIDDQRSSNVSMTRKEQQSVSQPSHEGSAASFWHNFKNETGMTSFCSDPLSDPNYESGPSNKYSLLGLTYVMSPIFLDPSDEFLTQSVNIGIPKQILGSAFMFQNEATK